MRSLRFFALLSSLVLLAALAPAALSAQQLDPSLFGGLKWRLIGPYRGGKVTSVAGAPGNPALYYMGSAGGGAWKTSDGGESWQNVTDSVHLTGIGAVYIAPSQPETVYVGTSGGAHGGLYRSKNGGTTWDLVALDGQAVASILIDPKNPDVVLAASGAGLMRTADGGATWKSMLPEGSGAVDLAFDPDNSQNVYVALRRGGGGRGGRGGAPAPAAAPTAEVYRSTDNGASWQPTSMSGLPPGNHGTVGLAVAPGSAGQRVYAYLAQGLWMSDNAGASWTRASDDPRLIGGGQFHDVYVDPKDANVMFAMQTSVYRSTDAGHTWNSFTGAPSGADFNALWISPANDRNMVLGVDQGAGVSMNGGHTWTTWYNQPTGQMYNVSTDHQFPFFMYASQQDSGTVAVPIRGNDGAISYRDWYTTNGFESARITPDPLHPHILYATGWYGSILRVDHTTGQTSHVFERNPDYREAGSPPMEFSPKDPRTLYIGTQYLLRTRDEGQHWEKASPDLTVDPNQPPAPAVAGRGGRGGGAAIGSIAPSPLNPLVIWAGTSNGIVQLTQDGGAHWKIVTPPNITGAVTMIEPGHTAPGTAYVVMTERGAGGRGGAGRGGPATAVPAPPLFRTTDFGRTWQAINAGLTGSLRVVREDSVNPQLLFSANDTSVFASFNGGVSWQDLDLNLPAASRRDLAIEQNDLVLATYGRGLWALDDIGPLRQLTNVAAASATHLFAPTPAYRLQWDTYTDTPMSPEIAYSQNPPDGAILDYNLATPPSGDIHLAIYDSKGTIVNEYSSTGPTHLPYKVNVPDYWLAPPQLLSTNVGENRFVWNLRYPDPPYLLYTYFGVHTTYFEYTLADHAIPGATPWHEPQGPLVIPGQYEVRLTVNGTTYRQPLTVKLDPRLTTITPTDLTRQLSLAQQLVGSLKGTVAGYNAAEDLHKQIAALNLDGKPASLKDAAQALDEKLNSLTDPPANATAPAFGSLNRDQARYLTAVTQADAAPATEVVSTVEDACRQYNDAVDRWAVIASTDTPAFNRLLQADALNPLTLPQPSPQPLACAMAATTPTSKTPVKKNQP